MSKKNQLSPRVAVIGAGAAGLFCASQSAKLGCHVTLLESAKRVGRKILMSGGGRCNFTNIHANAKHYLSENPHFCKSALARYTPWDFIALLDEYQISYQERKHGQFFCEHTASDIVEMLLQECRRYRVTIALQRRVDEIRQLPEQTGFELIVNGESCQFDAVVVATGGLSLPGIGVSPLGLRIAEQFGLAVLPTRAGLVPLTLHKETLSLLQGLAGISVDVMVHSPQSPSFHEAMLFTHRGLSGPAILQVSNYWKPGEALIIDLTVGKELRELLKQEYQLHPKQSIKNVLATRLPRRLLEALAHLGVINCLDRPLNSLNLIQQQQLVTQLANWHLLPNGTEGYRTAEVTLGGVSSYALSSKTMESINVKQLYFIGEVVDVTGWLGGFNFQWAWSSAWSCAQALGAYINNKPQ